MHAPPDPALMRALADVVISEETARVAGDRELAADLGRARERIDEYGNVIETRFLALKHEVRSVIEAEIAALDLKDGEPGPPGEPGPAGEIGTQGPAGPPGPEGPIAYAGQAHGLWKADGVYRAMDVVAWDGKEWRALRDDPGPLPGGDGWMLSAMRGEKGERGLRGEKGERGDRGTVGGPGERGLQGERGLKGEKGERGAKGERGETGPPGVGIKDILEENGLRILQLTDGREFVLESAA